MNLHAGLRLLILLTACGCSSSTPDRHTYSLTPTAALAAPGELGQIDIRVNAPTYLGSANIVLASGAHKLEYAAHHQWAEPVEEGFGRALRRELQRSSQGSTFDKDVHAIFLTLESFHGSLGGDVILEATWRIMGSNAAETRGRFAATVEQSGAGYAQLVEAHHALIQQLARALTVDSTAIE